MNLVFIVGWLSILLGIAVPPPPRTEAKPVKDKVHGMEWVDEFRWLEGDISNPREMGKTTPAVSAWTSRENAYTRTVLDGLPGRKELEEQLRPLMEVGSVSSPKVVGNRYFYTQREGSENQPRVFMREGHDGPPKLVLDPAVIDSSGLTTISFTAPSEDGKLLAYGTYRAGDENSTLHLMDVDTGKKLPLEIPGKVYSCDWMPDASGIVYRNLADIKNPYSGQVKYHKMGSEVANDPVIFRQFTPEENKALATTYGPFGSLSRDGRWLILGYSTDTRNNDLWCVDMADYLKSGRVDKRDILVGEAAQSGGTVVGDTLIMMTTSDAPNGRVVAVDLRNPAKANWKTLVAERPDAVISSVEVAKGCFGIEYLKNAYNTIEVFDLSGKPVGPVKLPGIGSASVATEIDRTEAYLTFTSYNYPTTIFRIDLAKPDAAPQVWARPPVPVDPATVEVTQEWYASKDGTKVSMFISHRKGLKRDGKNPTILYGYGGFNVSLTPTFDAKLFQWFDAGGVFAVANLRGGGEYGKNWHEAGRLERKQNVFDDYIAAAEHLISTRMTSTPKLAIYGGSNGGLLTGAAVTQRPELFGAVVCAVPLLDMLRYQDFLMARYWVPEYGSAESKEQFEFIRRYSPYQNIKPGTKYPAVFFTAGENDSRVHPFHARKMTAAMRAATSSDPTTQPILLWVDQEAGHGQGKPLNLKIRDAADLRIFLMWQLGMLDKPSGEAAVMK